MRAVSLASCSADGSVGCVTVTNYKSANMSVAIAGNILSGATIAGTAGLQLTFQIVLDENDNSIKLL